MFTTRAYNNFEIVADKGTVIKTSKTDRLAQEIMFYKNIPEDLELWFPRIAHTSIDTINTLEMEFYSYSNLGEFLIQNCALSEKDWVDVAKTISSALQKFNSFSIGKLEKSNVRNMYEEKTWREYRNLVQNFVQFKDLAKEKKIVINGILCKNFETIWSENEGLIKDILYTDLDKAVFTHGDMCFSNILLGIHNNGIKVVKFIDPRGKFGNVVAYGDPAYDYAKLMHSTEGGYEYFINDKFTVSQDGLNAFTLQFDNDSKKEVHNIFQDVIFSKTNQKRISLIQALIFIGMCARHYDSKTRQLAMYLTGVQILNRLFG